MITVIKRGVPKDEVPLQVDCRRCESILQFRPVDVERVFDQRDGDFYTFKCPVCGRAVTKAVAK